MIVMPNTWMERSQDVNPGKQSAFAVLLHDVDSKVIVSADGFGFHSIGSWHQMQLLMSRMKCGTAIGCNRFWNCCL